MSLPLLVFAAIIFLLLERFVYARWGLAKVAYERRFSVDRCEEGDEVELVERISNDKPIPLPWLRLEALMDASLHFMRQDNLTVRSGERLQSHRSLFFLRPFTEVLRRHKVRCVSRGYYELSSATMSCGDLFGASQTVSSVKVDASLLVYPKPVPLEELPLPWRGWQGDYIVRRWIVEDPFLTQGVREYRPGDSMRSVHWKATARTGQLQVHNRPHTADRHLIVLLNMESSEQAWGAVTDVKMAEYGIRCALTLIERCLEDGVSVGFACNGYIDVQTKQPIRIAPASGPLQRLAILEAMAKLQLALVFGCAELLLREERNGEHLDPADILLITSYFNESIQEAAARLEQRGAVVQMLPLTAGKEGYHAG